MVTTEKAMKTWRSRTQPRSADATPWKADLPSSPEGDALEDQDRQRPAEAEEDHGIRPSRRATARVPREGLGGGQGTVSRHGGNRERAGNGERERATGVRRHAIQQRLLGRDGSRVRQPNLSVSGVPEIAVQADSSEMLRISRRRVDAIPP